MNARALSTAVLSLVCGSGGAWSPVSLELADLAGRMEHGYYADDERVLEAALEGLARHAGGELAAYHEALGSYRLAQLRSMRTSAGLAHLLERCRARSEALTEHAVYAAEAWILVAACAQFAGRLEPLKALWHERRAEQALGGARALDPGNPRLALLEAQRWLYGNDTQRAGRAFERLEFAVQAFSAQPLEGPQWGEVEALTHLSELCLADRDLRRARDFIEQALLREPEYPLARAVRERVISAH